LRKTEEICGKQSWTKTKNCDTTPFFLIGVLHEFAEQENNFGGIAGICIALNYLGKHKRNMVIRGIE